MSLNRGYSYREQLNKSAAGRTALEYLVASQTHSSEEEWNARFARGELELDGHAAQPQTQLRPGAVLTWHRPPWDEPSVPRHYQTVLEDPHLLAVVKPRGLPTMPAGGFFENTLLTLVRERYPEANPMHRLGRETSGLVLFARTREAAVSLSAAWRTHEVEKRYRTLACGSPASDVLEIDAPIGPVPHPLLGTIHAASPKGKASHSVAHVLERRSDTTLFDVDISTGRPHQIRIHLAYAGHPLVGDPLYGVGGLPLDGLAALPGDGGYLLHAQRLCFAHPITGARIELVAPAPEDLERLKHF